MNCRAIEPLLFAERDGVLTAAQHASVEAHVVTCPKCREQRDLLATATAALRADAANVPLPDLDAEWNAVRSRLHDPALQPNKKRSLAPVIWFGAPLAAAAAVALAVFINRPISPERDEFAPIADAASAEFVEAGDVDASTMVFVDKESGWLVVWASDQDADHRS